MDRPETADATAYCAELVRRADPDRFLATVFAPTQARPGLLALYALNVELARAAETPGEPLLAQMRLAFWREAVAALPTPPPASPPVLRALAAEGFSGAALAPLVETREQALAGPPESLAALLRRIDEGGGTLMALALAHCGQPAPQAVAREAARAFGLSGLMRSVAWHAAAGRMVLPLDRLASEGLSAEDVLGRRPSAALRRVAAGLAGEAEDALAAARARRSEVAPSARSPLVVLRLAAADLARLRRLDYELFDPRLAARGAGRLLAALWAGLTRRY